jgi:acetyl-CoA carboxylase biotin carboxyl carrier protein
MGKNAGTSRPPAASGDDRLLDLTRRLANVINELGLSEIEVESAGLKVRVQRVPGGTAAAAPAAVVAAAPPPATAEHPVVADASPLAPAITIEAPMVGTFYRASSPTAEPYVREGDVVKEGQILCIIEAMKLMNEIESRAAGRVAKILVENSQPVEYGQALFLLEPQR